ncbi:hypothetical protein SAMN04515620_11929 [Collimonas sp. OK607]|nr:hypothetical protein SAMN04515620_11929 [Collimonas sp. OK607]
MISKGKYTVCIYSINAYWISAEIPRKVRHFALRRCNHFPCEPREVWTPGVFANCVKSSAFNGAGRRGGTAIERSESTAFLMTRQHFQGVKKAAYSGLRRCRRCRNNMVAGQVYRQRPARLSAACSFS